MKRICITLFILLTVFLSQSTAVARGKEASPSDLRLQKAYHAMLLADQAREQRNIPVSIGKYKEALEIYADLSANFPKEQKETVKFRTIYCNNQLDKILRETDKLKTQKDKEAALQASSKKGQVGEVQKLINKATAYIKNEQPDKARPLLMKGLNIDPDSSKMRLLMGISQCQAGSFKDAIYLLENLVEEDSKEIGAYVALSSAYLAMSDFSSALRTMERALALRPKNPEINFNMAQILLVIDPPRPEDAVLYYKKAIRLGSEPDAQLEKELTKF